MRKLLLLFSLFLINFVLAQHEILIKENEIGDRLNKSNLDIFAGAARVYNSKQNIAFARSSLLPKLNLWRLSSVLVDWRAAGEILSQDLVPFLIPSNWQRIKEMKLFNEAVNEGFHGLKKNTLFQVKLMYFQLQQEIYQYEMQEEYLYKLNKLIDSLKEQISLNPNFNQWYRSLSDKKTSLELDLLEMQKLIEQERQQLSISLDLESNDLMMTEPLRIEQREDSERYQSLLVTDGNVLDHSCELKEFDHLLKVAPLIRREIAWSFLGISDASRGVAGGVFDEIPMQDGLGFGMRSSLNINNKQVELLTRQREGVKQILLRQVQSIEYNMTILEHEKIIEVGKNKFLADEKERLKLQSTLGGNFNPISLSDIDQRIALAKILSATIVLKIKAEQEKLNRLYEKDEYQIDEI